jgi:hypothetical protein
MTTPGQPDDPNYSRNPGDGNPYNPGGQPGYPGAPTGRPADPYAPGSPGYPPPGGQGPGGPTGYPQQGGYPGQQPGYPAPGGYPGQQGGPPASGGYPGQQGYPGVQPYPAGPPGYQGYGTYPGGGLPPEPVRPNTVTYAFWCWLATTAVSLVGLILTLTSPIWDQAVAAGVQTSGGVTLDVQSLVTTVRIIAVVVFLIFAGVYLLFAFKMYAGRNWARIVLTVFGALSLLSALTPTTSSVTVNGEVYSPTSSGLTSVLPWVSALLAVAGIVLMFLAASNKFFTESKAYKQAKQQIRA